MNEVLVILINRALPYNCVGKLTGWSGAHYADSTFEEAFGAHVCRLPLSTWRQCKADITRGFVRPLSQWEVDFELPEAARCEMEDGKWKREGEPADGVEGEENVEDMIRSAQRTPEGSQASSPGSSESASEHPGFPSPSGHSIRPGASRISELKTHTAESLAEITNYRALLKVAGEAGVKDAERISTTKELREAILARQLQPA